VDGGGLNLLPRTVEKRISNLIVVAGPATTLVISPWFNYDPINLIKVLVLTGTSFAAFGLLLPYLPQAINRAGKRKSLILLFFCLALMSSFFFSGANKAQQFWGVFGRNTGILSYLALLAILFVTAVVANQVTYSRITWGLVVTVAIMSSYCLIQIAKLDPISWSSFFPFGTLGNVNFLSGFMGLGLVTVFIFAISNQHTKKIRIALAILFAIGIFVLIKSDSTQGMVALVVGVSTYLLIRSWYLHRALFIIASIIFISGFIYLVLGLLDKGPLRGLIYQFTVLYRADYMHAGIAMLVHNPFTGVGIDSYDDWYRAERGIISALRTSLNRTANSAHNISIDLAAGGGFPLLIAYLLILGVISWAILKGLRSGLAKDPIFMALSMSWLAYQVQASVSINQIGVGVWGWILGGALLGYSKTNVSLTQSPTKSEMIKKSNSKARVGKSSPNTPPALSVISSYIALGVGFTLAFLPFKTDIDFLRATNQGSAETMLKIAATPMASTFVLSKAAASAFQADLKDVGSTITEKLVTRFPRSIYGWLVIYDNASNFGTLSPSALEKIRQIDPYVSKCYLPNPSDAFRAELETLPPVEKYKLARGWGLVEPLQKTQIQSFSFASVSAEGLAAKLYSFCGS
jgi:O-antigen ligase